MPECRNVLNYQLIAYNWLGEWSYKTIKAMSSVLLEIKMSSSETLMCEECSAIFSTIEALEEHRRGNAGLADG